VTDNRGVTSRRSFIVGTCTAAVLSADTDLALITLAAASGRVRKRTISPVELTEACLRRIERLNPSLNAYITVTSEAALTQARGLEAELQQGHWRGPLHGIPIALKDNIDTAGIRTTAASELFKDRIPSEDAEVVRRLKNAGAILLGKTNLHEFAYGGTSSVTYFKPVHNPWALDRIPGGSSGGSAAATAAGLCFGSLGTDTAGSVRIPASYCGIVGFKPTYGRVSNRGVIPLSFTLDHVGPICRTVEDAALITGVIAGYDELDPTTVEAPVPDYRRAFKMPASKLRLGIPRRPYFDGLEPDIAKAVDSAIEVLGGLSGTVVDVTLPLADFSPGTPFSNVRAVEAHSYHSQWITESPEKYQPATRDRILQLSANVTPADYVRARNQLELLRREIRKTFLSVDLLVTPTMPVSPVLIADSSNADFRNTAPFDIFGLPAITVPCGFTGAGLPIGLQICGAPFAEVTVLALANAYQQATAWHRRSPPV
jgi:aspartyl-tRNA(Asn)/glutamyl-tRNA(Gln) amidotransferase subunit A